MTEDWTVTQSGVSFNKKTQLANPTKYTLRYKGKTVDVAMGCGVALEAQAKFANEKGLVPKSDVCKADGKAYASAVASIYGKDSAQDQLLLGEEVDNEPVG